MPIDPGTLAGYDQLLSISQEAINRQLKTLYGTKVKDRTIAGPKFLINHEMRFHTKMQLKNGKTIIARYGLDAYVCCPEVDFGGKDYEDEDKYRLATIKFKFRKTLKYDHTADEWEKLKKTDSILVYKEVVDQDENGRDKYEYPEVVVNGWEISWVALIDKQDIKNVMEDIVDPSTSPDSPIYISENVKTKLQDVKSSSFQNGKIPSEVKTTKGELVENFQNIVEDLRRMLVSKFVGSKGSTQKVYGPTPSNPFVLGYTASQDRPALKVTNEAVLRANIPPPTYFVPKDFRCNLSPKSDFCAGTLNYCMVTNRAKQPPDFIEEGKERIINYGVDGAERFPVNVFDKVKSKAELGSTEGVLLFCQDIFVNHWIGSYVAPLFFLRPDTASEKIRNYIYNEYEATNVHIKDFNFDDSVRPSSRSLSRNNEYTMTNSMRSPHKVIVTTDSASSKTDPSENVKLEYDTTLVIKYENLNALKDNELKDDGQDVKRRLKFTIGSYTVVKIKFFRRLWTSSVGKFFQGAFTKQNLNLLDDSNWEEAYDANIWLNYKYTFNVGTSSKNSGSFEVEKPEASHLDMNNNLITHEGVPPYPNAPGLWKQTVSHNFADVFSIAFRDELASLGLIGDSTALSGAALFKNAFKGLDDALGTTVILPAGDVFMFKGLSADEYHNVFTAISYNTPIDGTAKQQEADSVSFEEWQGFLNGQKSS